MNNYELAKDLLNDIPTIFIKQYLEDSGYIVKKKENKPDKFNEEFYKV